MANFEDVYVMNRGMLVNKYQGKRDNSLNQVITLQALPAPPSSALTSSGQFYFDISTSDLHMINDIRVRFDVLEGSGSSMILCPSPYFITKMEWQDKSGNMFWRSYNDTLFFEACSAVGLPQQTNAFLQSLNVSDTYFEGYIHPSSTTRIYRIPLISHPWSVVEQFAGNLSKLRLVLYWASSVVSSGSGTTSLSNVFLEMNHRRLPADLATIQRNYFSTAKRTRICYPDWYSFTGQTLNASTTTNLDLSSFKGKYPFFIYAVRTSNNSATSNGYLNTLPLGPKGTVDVLTPSGQSLFSNGTAVKNQILQEEFSDVFPNKVFADSRRWYLLSFCSNAKQALAGIESGYLRLDGSKHLLSLTPDAAKVDTVQTITLTSATVQSQGAFILQFKGCQTIPLAYNASAATIQNALNALPTFKNYPGGPLTATVSAAFSASAAPTITLKNNVGVAPNEDINLITFDNINSATSTTAASVDSAATTVSTYGTAGWVNGSSYIIDVYGYKQRWMTEYQGNITVEDDLDM